MKYNKAVNMAITATMCDINLPHELKKEIIEGLTEAERLAEIGMATEKALKDNEYCVASYKGNHLNSFKTIEELVVWAESEGE